MASPASESRRNFLTRGIVATGIVWTAPVLSTIASPAAATSHAVILSGSNFTEISPPANVGGMADDTNVLGFPEQCGTLAADLVLNRDGSAGSFNGVNGQSYVLAAGTQVCSFFFRSERTSSADFVNATIQFLNGTIVGLAWELAELGGSQAQFGVPGTNYNMGRPFENNDTGTVISDSAGDSLSLSLRTNGSGGSDSIRVLVTLN